MATTKTSPTPAEARVTSTSPEAGAASSATEEATPAATTTEAETAPERELTPDEKFLAEAESKRAPLRELEGVKYIGRAHSRDISKVDFEGVGVEVPEGFTEAVWNSDNGFLVPVSRLNAAIVDYLNADAEFELV